MTKPGLLVPVALLVVVGPLIGVAVATAVLPLWGFVVAGDAAVLLEPADGAFDDPSAFDDPEALELRILGDDRYRAALDAGTDPVLVQQ